MLVVAVVNLQHIQGIFQTIIIVSLYVSSETETSNFLKKKCCNYYLQPSEFNAYLSSAIEIVFVFLEISWVFMMKSSFIQITLVFPGFLLRSVKIITNTVRFQEALHFAQMFIRDVSGSYSVIL